MTGGFSIGTPFRVEILLNRREGRVEIGSAGETLLSAPHDFRNSVITKLRASYGGVSKSTPKVGFDNFRVEVYSAR